MLENLQELTTSKEGASRSFSCLAEFLAHHAHSTPDRDAILAPGRPPLTFGKLWACAEKTLATLRSAGIGRDDRVAVILPDGPDAAAVIVSVAAASVCVPLNPGFTADEWQRYFTETRITALLTTPDINSPSRAVARARGMPVLNLSMLRDGTPGFDITAAPSRAPSADDFACSADDAFILLTSGTTSRPKTIPLTHAAVCLSAYNVAAAIALVPQDRLLSVLPLYHGHGLISGVIATLAAGSSAVCTPGFDAAAFFDWLTKFRPTWYTAVPTIHRAVLETAEKHKDSARQSSLRLIRSASSTLPAKVLRGLEALFAVPVIDTFGMTESATQIAANPLHRRKLGSVGVAAGAEIAILDDAGRQLSPRQHGEIALRGETITRGYDNDTAATREAFRGGWFRTGDLGYLDQDGYLFIVGRVKEVINRGGQKVAPGEVEQALLRHPDVVDAAVYAVPHERLGMDVAAAVVLRTGAKVDLQKLRDLVRRRLASFKVPGLIQIVREIPKGAGGKIKRAELAVALAAIKPATPQQLRRDQAGPHSQVEREIAAIWAELLGIDHIGIEQDIFALGVDSITVTQMVSRLRERFAVDFSFKDIFEAPTVAALAARLQRSKKFAHPASSTLIDLAKDDARAANYGPQPVAIVQERMLRIEREVPGLPQFNLPFAYRLRGALDLMALKRSLAEVVRRHDSLRTGFAWRDEQPVAFITPPAKTKLSLVVEDFTGAQPVRHSRAKASRAKTSRTKASRTKASRTKASRTKASRTKASRTKALLRRKARLAAEHELLKPFDLSRAPLFRARLLRLGADDHVLLLVIHDIVIDGWSMGVFMQEVAQLYAAFTTGKQAQLPRPALRFSDFVRWQRQWTGSAAATRQFAYWRKRLRKPSPLFAATEDREKDGGLGAPMTQERLRVPKNVLAQLTDLKSQPRGNLIRDVARSFQNATAAANRRQRYLCRNRNGQSRPVRSGGCDRPVCHDRDHSHPN